MSIKTRLSWYFGLLLVAAGVVGLRNSTLTAAYLSATLYYIFSFPIWSLIGRWADWNRKLGNKIFGFPTRQIFPITTAAGIALATFFVFRGNIMLSSFAIMLSLYSIDEFLDLREASETKNT